MNPEIEKELSSLGGLHKRMLDEFAKVIVGQRDVLEELLITIFAAGHNLLEGVPGLAKTLMISTLARMLSLHFKRIQFTPDLMPSDIVGTNVIEEDHTTGKRVMVFVPGPIFANVLLADEINRTPPKTQAALLQAMQEKEVTAGGKTYRLEPPFFVLATQNPIDQEGTYPLPEAQKDRFLLNTFIRYPPLAEEEEIVERTTMDITVDVKPVCERDALLQAMQEKEVTAGGKTYRLAPPFFVLATQNPIDQEGTYPLPEAQKDRFLLNTFIKYPPLAEEEDIVERTTTDRAVEVKPVCDGAALLHFQHLIRSIPVSKHVTGYAVDLVRATRPDDSAALAFVKEQIGWGAGPRASQALIQCAKTYAALSGRLNVSCDNVRHLALPVLRHRLLASFAAEAEGITTDVIIRRLLETIPERKSA